MKHRHSTVTEIGKTGEAILKTVEFDVHNQIERHLCMMLLKANIRSPKTGLGRDLIIGSRCQIT